ncbi:phage protease [Thermus hydrothermalis]|uniref:phage protease n=1 Tax=Thermus hydrothermalis TaxID=2908148 RepID=UPI001FA9674F|nr:phage protease [Thermus hydrothermalis]
MPNLTAFPASTSTSTPTFSGTLRAALQEAPERIPLHPFGEFVGNGVLFLFDEASLAQVLRELAERGVPWVLDFHHQTVRVEEGEAQEAPAAGFVVGIEVGEDGFVYGRVEWSETGRERVSRGEYAYVSPVFYYDPTPDASGRHRVLGYHSFALTNNPGIRFQKRIEAEADMLERFRQALGLPPQAGEDEVFTALENLRREADVGRVVLELGLGAGDATELKATLLRLLAAQEALAELERTRQELAALQAQTREERAQALVRAALEEGRILPHQREFWLAQARADLEATEKALAGLPRLVPTELPKAEARSSLERDPAEELRRKLGVSDEAWRKYGG